MIKIKNWSSYQSYKDRRPPWIRFHKNLLDDFQYQRMSADARALLPMLWLLASEDADPTSGLIRDSYESVTFRLRMCIDTFVDALQEIEKAGFIEILENDSKKIDEKKRPSETRRNKGCYKNDTKELQECYETVTPETETETETDIGEDKSSPLGGFENFWKIYPKRSGANPRAPAEKKFTAACKRGAPPGEIIAGAKRYAAMLASQGKTGTEFVAQAVTWLNQERWKDDYGEPPPKAPEPFWGGHG